MGPVTWATSRTIQNAEPHAFDGTSAVYESMRDNPLDFRCSGRILRLANLQGVLPALSWNDRLSSNHGCSDVDPPLFNGRLVGFSC